MAPYLFVAAAFILSICVLFFFSMTLAQLKREPESYQTLMPRFMMKVFMSEIIPIALIVYGFSLKHRAADISELYVPFAIIISIIVITSLFIFLQVKIDVEPEQRGQLMTLGLMSIAFANSISLIGIIALIAMM